MCVAGVKRPYARLRAEMADKGFDLGAIQFLLKRSRNYTSKRLMAQEEWQGCEMYRICDMLGWSRDRVYELFPLREEELGAFEKRLRAAEKAKKQKGAV